MIDHYEFGKFTIDNVEFECNVALINNKPTKLRHFDDHVIKKDDFISLVESKPEYIIIGTGASGVVQVPDDIIKYIKENNIILIIKKTADACKEYNKLTQQNKKVAALLHNTC